REDVEDYPIRTMPRLAESVDDFQSLGRLQLFDLRGLGAHDQAQLVGELVHGHAAQQLLDRLGAHLGHEDVAELRAQLAVALFRQQLLVVDGAGEIARINDHVRLEVEDALEIAQGDVEQVADARRQALEEPDVRDWASELDVTHALAADFGLGDFDAALVADHAAVLHALVLAAEALPVGDGAENLGAEQAVALRLEGAVVDRLRLGHFAVRPATDLLRARQRDLDGVEVVDRLRLGRLKQ